jgi:pyrroline-5-carboxylate reductase
VSESQKGAARSILAALGSEVFVTDERLIDMATAVSGSGPAYFFLMMEALTDAAADIGLPREIAEKLVSHTALGASRLVQETGERPSALRQMVTSKGGTTERGLHQLEQGGLRALIAQAVAAAYERAKELGG